MDQKDHDRGGQRFGRRRRLRRRSDYVAVQERGRRVSGPSYVLLALPRGDAEAAARVGITVSRKVGKAVVRNRVKRWVRESCRRLLPSLPPGVDIVVVARPPAAGRGYAGTAQDLSGLVSRLGKR